ncbi:CbrC family protein [Streptomyces sp. SYSU K217416]
MTDSAGTEPLPSFPYHPDPIATGSVIPSDTECASCGRRRGYVYVGPVYAVESLRQQLCPWCIADGTAAERYEAQFTEVDSGVTGEVARAIEGRTPGFSGWQQERWLVHCGDGAAFLGRVGAAELTAYPDAVEHLRMDLEWPGREPERFNRFLSAVDADDQPTAYLFRCRSCAEHLAYADFT